MRILFLDHSPKSQTGQPYDVEAVTRMLNSYASAGTTIEIGFPDNFEGSGLVDTIGSQNVLNGLQHMMETPSLVRKIFWAEENGYDAVISSNTFEPGVEGGRLSVSIPVIGALRTTMHAALTLADRVGITVPLSSHIPYTRRILRGYGLDRFVSDIEPIGVYADVQRRKAEIFETTVKLIKGMVARGAEIIMPLGGALIPYVVDPADLATETGVQVFNTKAISVAFAEMCVRNRITQSAITYPKAALKLSDFVSRA